MTRWAGREAPPYPDRWHFSDLTLRRMSASRHEQSYNGSAQIDSRGWQRNYAPNRRIFTYVRRFRYDLVRLVMTGTAYLAGPDVFLPNAVAHAATKVEICRRLGLRGLPPLNEDAEKAATELEVWQAIYEKDVAMMEKSDVIIAHLTPFAGASADAGTLIEVGWFLGKGKPIFGYSNTPKTSNPACGDSLAQSMRTSASRVPPAGQPYDCRSGP